MNVDMTSINTKDIGSFTPGFIGSLSNFKALSAKRQEFLHHRLEKKKKKVRLL
jgi:hypothetical protein